MQVEQGLASFIIENSAHVFLWKTDKNNVHKSALNQVFDYGHFI